MADAEPYRRLFRIEAGDLSDAARLRHGYEGLAGHASDRQTVHRELTLYFAARFRDCRESVHECGPAGLRCFAVFGLQLVDRVAQLVEFVQPWSGAFTNEGEPVDRAAN